MSSNYILAKGKNEEIAEKGACGGAVSNIFQYLLDKDAVEGILTLKKEEDVYDGIPQLVTNSDEILETCGSLHCAPTMVGDLISKFLGDKVIGVALKPCDAMAVNELEKRSKIDQNNLYKIGLNCGGTVMPVAARKMIDLFYEVDPDDVIKEEIDKGQFIIELKDGSEKSVKIDDLEDEGWGRRENCQRCEVMIPRNTDIACGNWGSEDGWTFVEIITEKGQKLVDDARSGGYIEVKTPPEKLIEIRSKVESIMIKLANKFQTKLLDKNYPSLEAWDNYWNRCIECYGCRDVCPVCYCNECELEEEYFNKKDRITPNPLTFHGVRLSHMSFSCVNCGQCEDVCPMEIPVSRIFDKLQKKYKEKTGYVAGISDEKPPMYSPKKE